MEKGGKATAKDGVLQIDAVESGALAFTASTATAPPGRIEFVMENPSPIDHNIALEDGPEGDVVGNGGHVALRDDAQARASTSTCAPCPATPRAAWSAT